jgi:uncharacterized Fe-S center protein
MGEENRMTNIVFFKEFNHFSDALSYFDLTPFTQKEIPLKLHMGELKNKYYPKAEFVSQVVAVLKQKQIAPYLFDSTVAYPGLRHTKSGYEQLAKIHGFTQSKVGCNVVIDDQGIPVRVDSRAYEVVQHLYHADAIIALSHVKGHVATGMGGAIKNFGMGGVTKETKRRMHHGSRPIYHEEKCNYCGVCAKACPFDALTIKPGKRKYSIRACFGCGVCVEVCPREALSYEDDDLQYVLACAAYACVHNKHVLYLNEVKRIADSCDCDPTAKHLICPDIGYLVGDDPVAIDKASLDLIYAVKPDIFKKEIGIDPYKQIKYGEERGLGTSSYTLHEL